jgi:urease accessory protein
MDRWFTRRAHGMSPMEASVTELDRLCEAHVAIDGLGEASRRVGLALLTTHERIGTPGASSYAARVRSGEAPGHAAIVQAVVGTGMALSLAATEAAALYGVVNSALTAAIRLGIIGALAAQRMLAHLADAMAGVLAGSPPALPSAFTPLADIAVSRHAGGPGRLFSS